MGAHASPHPSLRRLAACALGRLPAEDLKDVEAHLAECRLCADCLSAAPREFLTALLEKSDDVAATVADLPEGGLDSHDASTAPWSLPEPLRRQKKYQVVRLLGRGGMGAVYEALHVRMERRVALKVIHPSFVDHPEAAARFDREIRAAAMLDHPNVARAYDAEEFDEIGRAHV